MCFIAPGGIPDMPGIPGIAGIAIGPGGDIAAAELTAIDEAIVARTTATTTAWLTALENPLFHILKFIGGPRS